ncbi:hypothetical protein [Paenibacillus cremeus]|uniref:Uncharacterized protein n=1 Tax=Paenibacillus cremeus TaxID=2163881 RepID=A0A559KCQ2_9BACL|nr:hypothetical protein [Paenibacillus cremeus]TVY09908.1 hypothetical protein FPZ49_11090 [Paenibacillus cremeus]
MKILKLPRCDNIIVIPLRYSGGGIVCTEIRNNGEVVSGECYIHEIAFEDAIDLTEIFKSL